MTVETLERPKTETEVQLKPFGSRVVAVEKTPKSTSAGGIIIPAQAQDRNIIHGEVVGVGNKISPTSELRVGRTILFGALTATLLKENSTTGHLYIVEEDNILAIEEK